MRILLNAVIWAAACGATARVFANTHSFTGASPFYSGPPPFYSGPPPAAPPRPVAPAISSSLGGCEQVLARAPSEVAVSVTAPGVDFDNGAQIRGVASVFKVFPFLSGLVGAYNSRADLRRVLGLARSIFMSSDNQLTDQLMHLVGRDTVDWVTQQITALAGQAQGITQRVPTTREMMATDRGAPGQREWYFRMRDINQAWFAIERAAQAMGIHEAVRAVTAANRQGAPPGLNLFGAKDGWHPPNVRAYSYSFKTRRGTPVAMTVATNAGHRLDFRMSLLQCLDERL